MTLPTYGPVRSPVAKDMASGPAAFNTMAGDLEDNNDMVNGWAAIPDAVYAATSAVTLTDLATPATGWAFKTDEFNYGRRWGAVTFVKLGLVRTGAAFAADYTGNVAPDMLVATLKAPFLPIVANNVWLAGVYELAPPCTFAILASGLVYLTGMNQPNQSFATGNSLYVQTCWINTDPQPI